MPVTLPIDSATACLSTSKPNAPTNAARITPRRGTGVRGSRVRIQKKTRKPVPSPSSSAAAAGTTAPTSPSASPSQASPTSRAPVASTETLIEPSSVTPRTTSTRRSCQKRASDVGRIAGSAH